MSDKKEIITTLRDEFKRWEELLASLSEEQITAPLVPSKLSIKDTMAHLRAWQQRSIARMQAALLNKEPEFPKWSPELDPDSEGSTDKINAWIYETHRDQPWSSVHRDWREGFLRLVELAEAVPEKDLMTAGRYSWLWGHALAFILTASYEHHHIDHFEPLVAWLGEHGKMKSAG